MTLSIACPPIRKSAGIRSAPRAVSLYNLRRQRGSTIILRQELGHVRTGVDDIPAPIDGNCVPSRRRVTRMPRRIFSDGLRSSARFEARFQLVSWTSVRPRSAHPAPASASRRRPDARWIREDSERLRKIQNASGPPVTAVTGVVTDTQLGCRHRQTPIISRMEDEMRKIITIAIIVATATVTTAWALSTIQPNRGATMVGGGGAVPTRGVISW